MATASSEVRKPTISRRGLLITQGPKPMINPNVACLSLTLDYIMGEIGERVAFCELQSSNEPESSKVFVCFRKLLHKLVSLKEHQSSTTAINHNFLVAPNDLQRSIISRCVTFVHLGAHEMSKDCSHGKDDF